MSKKKPPLSTLSRPDSKSVRFSVDHRDEKPSWRFSTADRSGPFSWPNDQEKRIAILDKLHSFDSMRWSEIEGPDHHAVPVDDLSPAARKRLAEIGQDDIDEVFSFHLGGRPRLICIRALNVAKVLWYDPKHAVCPSKKKHT